MFKILGIIMSLLAGAAYAEDTPHFTLGEDIITISGQFDGKMAGKFIRDVTLAEGKELTVFIDSPGGSVASFLEMAAFMEGVDKKFICLASFAASAASAFLNVCDERYVLRNGVLMFHQASYGLRGGTEANLLSFQKYISSSIDKLEKINADRMGLDVEVYKDKVVSDLWLFDEEGVKEGAADAVATAECSPVLFEKKHARKETLTTFFGQVQVEFSGCPLLTYPTKINGVPQLKEMDKESQRTVRSYLSPRVEFIEWLKEVGLPLMTFK